MNKKSTLINSLNRIPDIGDTVEGLKFAVDAIWIKFKSGKEFCGHIDIDDTIITTGSKEFKNIMKEIAKEPKAKTGEGEEIMKTEKLISNLIIAAKGDTSKALLNQGFLNADQKQTMKGRLELNGGNALDVSKELCEQNFFEPVIEEIIIEVITAAYSGGGHSQKGDVSDFLADQGFFSDQQKETMKKRDKLPGGNPIDIKQKFDEQN
jgi:hypothetical protein